MSEETNTEELVEHRGRRIYPEVAAYLKGRAVAHRERQLATIENDNAWSIESLKIQWAAEDAGQHIYGRGEYADRYRAAERAHSERAQEIRRRRNGGDRALLESPHPEVKFIAEKCLFADQGEEVERHARTILSILPATTEEIWTKAKAESEMCGVFDRFYDQAEQAGVFQKEGEDPFPGMRELVALRGYVSREFGHNYAARVMEKMHPALKAVKADYDRRLEEAKAEWQKQDEAYAENTHRNRSEGARRAAETRRRNTLAERAAEALREAGVAAAVMPVDPETGELPDAEVFPQSTPPIMPIEIR